MQNQLAARMFKTEKKYFIIIISAKTFFGSDFFFTLSSFFSFRDGAKETENVESGFGDVYVAAAYIFLCFSMFENSNV